MDGHWPRFVPLTRFSCSDLEAAWHDWHAAATFAATLYSLAAPELLCAAVSLFDQGRGTLPLFSFSANSAGIEHNFANYNSKI